jgi:outer membrane receptor for monomeric catechols
VGGAAVAAPVYTNKLLGNATLLEVGIKGQSLRGKLQWTLAGFKQERVDVSGPADPSSSAEVSSTVTKGVEASMNFAATKKLFVGLSGTWSDARYAVGAQALNIDVNAEDLGFKDVVGVNPDGSASVMPANALLYGGRYAVTLTDPNNVFDKVPGSPKWQAALNSTYQLPMGFGLLANAQYTSWSWGSRLQTIKIPESTQINVGATWDGKRVHFKANVYNLMDDIAFRATNGSGNRNMASVLPDRRYEASMKVDF